MVEKCQEKTEIRQCTNHKLTTNTGLIECYGLVCM